MISLTTLSCFVALALVTACAPQRAPGSPLSTQARPSPAARASEVAAAVTVATPLPLPTVPAEAREAAELLRNVCQMGAPLNPMPGELSFGCVCCAPFDGCKPSDPPVVADESVYFPHQTISGAFTSAGADQRVMPMWGCETHAENYGGTVLLERGTDGFVLHRYISGLSANQCWPVRRVDGRDLLVCTRSDVHQGTAEQNLFVSDLTASDAQIFATPALLYVSDDEMSGCWSERGRDVSSTEMAVPRLSTRAGHVELTVELDVREGKVTAPYLARCKELQESPDDAPSDPKRRPRTLLRGHTEHVAFRFNGTKFVRR